MPKVSVNITIDKSIDKVYALLSNVSNYPLIFPFYESVKLIENKDTEVWIINAFMKGGLFSVKGKIFKWHSSFIFNNNISINTNEIGPRLPLKTLNAVWTFTQCEKGTEVSLSHFFYIDNRLIFSSIFYPIIKIIIKINSNRLLCSVKQHIEKKQ